jgi:hypothetical protein
MALVALLPLTMWVNWGGRLPWVTHLLVMANIGGFLTLWGVRLLPAVFLKRARYAHWLQFHFLVWNVTTVCVWAYWTVCSALAGVFGLPWAALVLFYGGIFVMVLREQKARDEMAAGWDLAAPPRKE